MQTLWLIANSMSKTTNETIIAGVCDTLRAHGFAVEIRADLSQEEMPDGEALPEVIACLGGDGTASAVIDRYGKRDVPLLVLPGGTMNLLAHRLHGDAGIDAIIARAAERPDIVTLPHIVGPGFHSLVGVIAGATTAWGDMREALRSGDIEGIVEQTRAAIQSILSAPSVRIKGQDAPASAVFIEPLKGHLRAQEIKADTLSDIAQHGWAWINRRFLGGPMEPLTHACEITLSDEEGSLALLVDGESREVASPVTLRWENCPARFIATYE